VGHVIEKLESVQRRLDALARTHRVAGASLAILDGSELLEFTTGVTSVNTGVDVTPETLFQIGSNTKLYTTTLLMQLVDEGRVKLDKPVRTYVRGFKVADSDAAASITVKQLLNHTSGIQGDYFADHGRGDDCVANYVESMAELTQVTAPGKMFSYCNSGFTLAGRLIEEVRGAPYHEVLKERLLAPLGLRSTTVLAEEMLAFRYAVGHLPGPDGRPVPAPMVLMPRSSAPAGSLTSATARDVLGFVQMHLDHGKGSDGKRILSEKAVLAMQSPTVAIPGRSIGSNVGLGWMVADWDGEPMIGHGGGTIGQLSFLHVLPRRRFAVCLLTNTAAGGLLFRDLGRWIFQELAGVSIPAVAKPADPKPSLDLKKYEGRYERLGVAVDVVAGEGELRVTSTATGPLARLGDSSETVPAQPVDAETFYTAVGGIERLVAFLDFQAGRPRFVHMAGRAAARSGPAKKAAVKKAPRPARGRK